MDRSHSKDLEQGQGLEETVKLRDNYDRKYDWAKQIKELVDKMISLTHGKNVNYISFSGSGTLQCRSI